jgi:hypothetical protein
VSELPPEDRAPDYPPRPRGPEDAAPGPRFILNKGQLARISEIVAGLRYSTFELEDRGEGYFMLRLLDADGEPTREGTIFPLY